MDESSQEEDEESSSSSSFSSITSRGEAKNPNLDDELEKFRRNWRSELAQNADFERKEEENQDSPSEKFYRLAMLCEQKGRVREAVELYRRALKLNPEIEKQFLKPASKNANFEPEIEEKKSKTDENDDFSTSNGDDLLKNLLKFYAKNGGFYCEPEKRQKNRHIGTLPAELLILIFKWVVSSHLDVRQLEQLSMVCRGFYVLCRRDEIWRSICRRCWPGLNLAMADSKKVAQFRKLYIEKPRLLYTGLYISKISYVRRGEDDSFQDRAAFSQQWHLVTYYRYLRFFENGHVIMITTSDEPQNVVPRLKNPQQIWQNSVLSRNALSGSFVLEIDDNFTGHVTCVFRRWKNDNNFSAINSCDSNSQCFIIELRICPPKKRTFALEWRNYHVKMTNSADFRSGQKTEDVNILQINDRHFAPFYFSRVKSYANYSEACL